MSTGVDLKCLIVTLADEKAKELDKAGVGGTLRKIFGDISKQSVLKQTAVGGVSGCVSGYLLGKVGRMAAAGVGVSVLLIQVAQYKGYIKINWKNVEKEIKKAKDSLSSTPGSSQFSYYLDEVVDFLRGNVFLAAGFGGGFLIGFSV